MVGSDFVAIALITVFGTGFIYFSFILPMKQKKNGTWNETVFNNEDFKENKNEGNTMKAEALGSKTRSTKASTQRNKKIMK